MSKENFSSSSEFSYPRLTPEDIEFLMKAPSSAIAFAISSGLLENGDVLDIGCGNGRNSLLLARNGFNVTGVDNDPQKIEQLNRTANEYGFGNRIRSNLSDLTTLDFAEPYANMVAIYSLRFLPKEKFLPTMDKLMSATTQGGVHIIQDLTQNGPLYTSQAYGHWLAKGELPLIYESAGWEVLSYSEEDVPTAETDSQGRPCMHQAATIVARKMLLE